MAKILIIDDDQMVQTVFKQFLERQGHQILVADDGRKGMNLFHEAAPDLVITDIMMPEMDGLEILLELRKKQEDVPVIAISGGVRDLPVDFLGQAKAFGACQVLEKPISLKVLDHAVKTALKEVV